LGLKVDEPFQRQGILPHEGGLRFTGSRLDLAARRLEAQAAWALRPDVSLGVGIGVARLSLDQGVVLRAVVPVNPLAPISTTNPAEGLVETELTQSSQKTVPAFSLGFRWAIGPRWTLGGTYQGALRATVDADATFVGEPSFWAPDGFGLPPLGMEAKGRDLLGASRPLAGRGRLVLPARATLGVRQRLNQFFTWEADLRYVGASSMEVPNLPALQTPSGLVESPREPLAFRSGFGWTLMGEATIGKRWTVRAGLGMDPASLEARSIAPLWGGAMSSAFSGGVGFRVWGGEWNVGYQYRQARDIDTRRLDGLWDVSGFRPSGTLTRVEGMGHQWSLGFRKGF